MLLSDEHAHELQLDDPGFRAFEIARANGKVVRAYLDGAEVHLCTMADDERGIVERMVLVEQGGCQIDPDNPAEIWTELVRGEVEIVIEDGK